MSQQAIKTNCFTVKYHHQLLNIQQKKNEIEKYKMQQQLMKANATKRFCNIADQV